MVLGFECHVRFGWVLNLRPCDRNSVETVVIDDDDDDVVGCGCSCSGVRRKSIAGQRELKCGISV